MGAKENILKNLRMKIKSLCVFNSIKEDVVVNKLYRIMDLLDNKEDIDIILDSYNDFTYELINNNGGSLKRYFIDKLISKENLLS